MHNSSLHYHPICSSSSSRPQDEEGNAARTAYLSEYARGLSANTDADSVCVRAGGRDTGQFRSRCRRRRRHIILRMK